MKDTPHPSSQSTPGFEVVQNEENGFYYFRCNDINGKPILQSKDYQTKDTAEDRLKSALRLAKLSKNYLRRKESNKHYFILRSGNKQEVARSILFANEKDLQRNIDYIKQVANSEKAVSKVTEEKVEEKKTAINQEKEKTEAKPGITKEQDTGKQATSKSRHSFRIDLYPREEGDTYSGRIEYLLSEESATFQGVDEEKIIHFIRQHLPSKSTTSRGVASPKAMESAELLLLSQPGGKSVHLVRAGTPLLHFLLRNIDFTQEQNDPVHVKVAAHSLDGSMRTSFETSALPAEDKSLQLSLPGNYFSPGTYKVHMHAFSDAKVASSAAMQKHAEASCLFQVY